jgi:hypothetical protein
VHNDASTAPGATPGTAAADTGGDDNTPPADSPPVRAGTTKAGH